MRSIAGGDKGFEKYPELLKKNFVFLNVYCTSVAEEEAPRGPKGPFQFQDKSVPVLVIKKWDGTTLTQQLGFAADVKAGTSGLATTFDEAIAKNGKVAAPKLLAPLKKSFEKGEEALKKENVQAAIKAFKSIVDAGANKKQFPDGPPAIADDAAKQLEAIALKGDEELMKTADATDEDPAAARKAYTELLAKYKGLPELEKKFKEAIDALPK